MFKVIKSIASLGVLILLVGVTLCGVLAPTASAAGDIAVRSKQPIYIDGWSVVITAYSINGSNFIRLRDIGYAIGFDVRFDSADKTVSIHPKDPYSGNQSMLGKTPERAEAAAAHLPIYVDRQEVAMLAYNIGGNNYVKLRDIGAAVGFNVEWDATRKRVLIDTAKPNIQKSPELPSPETVISTNIPGDTVVNYSLQANPVIFDSYYTREKYNVDRQRVLDTGTYVNWGTQRTPQSAEAIVSAENFLSGLSQISELEKVNSINTFLCARMTYRSGVDFSGNDFWIGMAYGVCEDYARIFQYICYRAGIPCLFVTGIADGNRHAWNAVFVGGEWQFYDGNLSDIRQTIALGEMAKAGHIYTVSNPELVLYQKEVYVPGSTL